MSRVRLIVEKLHVSESWVIRRAVLQGLADVEVEVLGVTPAPVAPIAPLIKSEPLSAKAARADRYADSHTKRNLRSGLQKLVAEAAVRNGKSV